MSVAVDDIVAEYWCHCGAHGWLLAGATDEDWAAFYEDNAWHDSCEPREPTPADVLPDAAAIAALVPDDFDTAYMIEEAERIIAHPVVPFNGLRERIASAEAMVTWAVLHGRGIADIRSWAIRVALLRDAMPTAAESRVSAEERSRLVR